MKQDIYERIIKGKKQMIYPKEVKQAIVKEIESGTLSVKEAQSKYGIHQAATIQSWLKQYSEEYRTKHMRVMYTDSQRRAAVREIESGRLHIQAASVKYKVSTDTIKDWIKDYSCESKVQTESLEMTKKKTSSSVKSKTHKKELEELKLKIAGLETMIDIAEEQFNIEIRKKFGTKQ